ncbi:hypothetical protein [Thalassotalea euphylliae]|uniref:Uncharacterized protein n=1 Tax=Thalassotalea euphylliae TaxID=1655234 RepID=A0A3E0UCI3_9GAMM|nr:hypothetical protein [Thalassotalea euphylliae]REL34596.1 hypothetical protein DXX92_04050 [Thalassotalea euphylliae]
MNMQQLKNKVCTNDNAQIAIALVFASLMIAISLLTQGSENNFAITLLLIAGYFSCSQAAKQRNIKD